ncbi:MAG: class I SAM-dependent methyltransferase [Longimicrobiales bacterium]
MTAPQVSTSHYEFRRYIDKPRWNSIWHQIETVNDLGGGRVLEVGPGPGVFTCVARAAGLLVATVDIDPHLRPDCAASVTDLPFPDGAFDVAVAFQVLEHVPYETSLRAFCELARVAARGVVVSLPDARKAWRYLFHVPTVGQLSLLVPRPRLRAPEHTFDGQHYWEIGKRGYAPDRVFSDFMAPGMHLEKAYRVPENPYHHFLIFRRTAF